MLSFGEGSQLSNCRPCLCIVLFVWLPGSSLFTPEPLCSHWAGCCWDACLPVQEAAAAAWREGLAGLPLGQLPLGNGAGLHSPAACMLREASLNVETCTYLSHRKSQHKNGGSLLLSITFHITHFFTSDPKMGQQWHNSETENPVQHYTRSLSFAPPLNFIPTTFRGSALCLCTTLMATSKLFKCLSRMHITNRFLQATWTEWISLLRWDFIKL